MPSSLISYWLREPLIQFLLLAALLFAVDSYVLGNQNDPRHIVIDDARLLELIAIFKEGQGREPSADELNNMIIKWSQNEILYREAQQMEMDQGDEMIRNRLVLKMRNVLFNRVIVDTPTEDELTAFFEFNRKQYDLPAFYDIEQFQLPEDIHSDRAATLLASLNSGNELMPEFRSSLRRYQQRPASNLQTMLGVTASQTLLKNPPREWVLLDQDDKLHLARITRIQPPQQANLDDVKSQVIRDWKQFRNDIQLADQTKALADRYRIELELSPRLSTRLETTTAPVANPLNPANTPIDAVGSRVN